MNLLELAENRRWPRVGDFYEVTKKPRNLDASAFETVPFAPMNAIPRSGAYTPTFTLKPLDTIASGTYFERGDILVAKITPSFENGKQALALDLPAPFGYATTEVIPLHPCNTQHDRRLLFFYLLHPDIRHYVAERMEGSTNRRRVLKDILLDLPFPVFDLENQTTISDSLELIQKTRLAEIKSEQITTALKSTVMQTLFTHGLQSEAQKETEIGPMPKSWRVESLDSLCLPTHQLRPSQDPHRQIKYVDVSSISRTTCQVTSTTKYRFCDAPSRARKEIRSGDVLFATVRPTLLRAAHIGEHLDHEICSTAFCVLRDKNPAMNGKLIFQLVQRNEFVAQLGRIETGANYPAVTDRQVKSQLVPVPSDDEQREIVTVLDTIDRKIDLHRRKRAVLDDLFKTLLHKLMTNEIRIADLDLSVINEAFQPNGLPMSKKSSNISMEVVERGAHA